MHTSARGAGQHAVLQRLAKLLLKASPLPALQPARLRCQPSDAGQALRARLHGHLEGDGAAGRALNRKLDAALPRRRCQGRAQLSLRTRHAVSDWAVRTLVPLCCLCTGHTGSYAAMQLLVLVARACLDPDKHVGGAQLAACRAAGLGQHAQLKLQGPVLGVAPAVGAHALPDALGYVGPLSPADHSLASWKLTWGTKQAVHVAPPDRAETRAGLQRAEP